MSARLPRPLTREQAAKEAAFEAAALRMRAMKNEERELASEICTKLKKRGLGHLVPLFSGSK